MKRVILSLVIAIVGTLSMNAQTCNRCGDEGIIREGCQVCNGNGGSTCDHCKGTGEITCETCHGDKGANCYRCEGTGKDDNGNCAAAPVGRCAATATATAPSVASTAAAQA